MNRLTRPPNRQRPATAGFTLVELLVALVIGSFVFAAALSGIIALQRAYAATEQYASNLADQTRLLDCLGMDLRRARVVEFDPDRNGMTITLPDYYYFNRGVDRQFTAPLPNTPRLPDDLSRAVYTSPTQDLSDLTKIPVGGVYYHFDAATKTITREEFRRSLPTDPRPTSYDAPTTNSVYGQRKVASSLLGFPEIQLRDDAGNPLGAPNTTPLAGQIPLQASITVCFKPIFSTVSTPDTNLIRLHGRVFLRNNDPGTN